MRRMKAIVLAIAIAAGLAGPAAATSWGYADFYPQLQGKKGHAGPAPERAEPRREQRFERPRPDERRERMSEDDRRALHRDLDKANRELYRRR